MPSTSALNPRNTGHWTSWSVTNTTDGVILGSAESIVSDFDTDGVEAMFRLPEMSAVWFSVNFAEIYIGEEPVDAPLLMYVTRIYEEITWNYLIGAELIDGGTLPLDGLPEGDLTIGLRIRSVGLVGPGLEDPEEPFGVGVAFEVSLDGSIWTTLNDPYAQEPTGSIGEGTVALSGMSSPVLLSLNGFSTIPSNFQPLPDHLQWLLDQDEEPYAPEEDSAGCSSVLELIREFSKAIMRPIRITSPTSIEIVDYNDEGLPGDMTVDEDSMYVEGEYEEKAGAEVLNLNLKYRSFSASAKFKENDVRLLASGWKLPQAIPLFGGLPPALVSRVSFSFTPKDFNAEVEFNIMPETPTSFEIAGG